MGGHHGYTFIKKNDRHRINITLHELLHGNGFAWPCTKGQSRGHVTGRSISSNQNNSPDTLGDMIYNHSNNGCPDLKDSIYMAPTPKDPYDPLPWFVILQREVGEVFLVKPLTDQKSMIIKVSKKLKKALIGVLMDCQNKLRWAGFVNGNSLLKLWK